MKRTPGDTPGLIAELETPPLLLERREHMLAEAPPCLGLGYRKERLDSAVFARLADHFRSNVENFRAEYEIEEIGNDHPGTIPTLIYEDKAFNARLAEELRPIHEAWAGMPLELSYCYGIRCYQRGTYLYNHVDRQPHFVSATICVDHALDSPWPLHIEGIDGEVRQIDMEPGEFVFYEGTRLVHGRPYPLDGDYYAGVFVHYRPADGSTRTTGG